MSESTTELGVPSETARNQIGKDIIYTSNKPPTSVAARIIGVERTFSTITSDDGTWPGIRYLIKPADGGRNMWTNTFADRPSDDEQEANDG